MLGIDSSMSRTDYNILLPIKTLINGLLCLSFAALRMFSLVLDRAVKLMKALPIKSFNYIYIYYP